MQGWIHKRDISCQCFFECEGFTTSYFSSENIMQRDTFKWCQISSCCLILPTTSLFLRKLIQANNKLIIKALYYWLFVWRIHQSYGKGSHVITSKENYVRSVGYCWVEDITCQELYTQFVFYNICGQVSTMIPDLHPANERRRYNVTASLIGWVQT